MKGKKYLSWILVTVLPIVWVTISLRIMLLPAWLSFEYQRSSFPSDSYGLTTQDRLNYAPIVIEYLLQDVSPSFFDDKTLPANKCFPPSKTLCPLFNSNEIKHLVDVKMVIYGVFIAGILSFLVGLSISAHFIKQGERQLLLASVWQSTLILFAIFIAVIFSAVVAWDSFFEQFHSLFFEDGTWQFYYSDTLIRLFPEQFWFDSAITLGILTLSFAVLSVGITWRLNKLNLKTFNKSLNAI